MKFIKHKFLITSLICLSLYFSFNMLVYSDNSTELYQKFLKAVDKVNKNGDNGILKVRNSLKSLDSIYSALNKYYQKSAKDNPDSDIVALLQLTQTKRGLAYSKLKKAEKSIKEFQKNDKKGLGDLDKLRSDLEPLILNFNDYKSSLSQLIDAIQIYHDTYQSATPSATPKSSHNNND